MQRQFKNKKKWFAILSTIVAFVLVFSAISFVRGGSVSTYSSENPIALLQANFGNTSNKTLSDWEKEILEKKSSVAQVRNSFTTDIAISAMEEYLKIRGQNISATEEEIVQRIIAANPIEDLQREIEFKKYAISDLNIIAQIDEKTLKNYGNKFGEINLENTYDTTYGTEFDIFSRAMDTERKEELEHLNPIIESYEKLAEELLNMNVPSNAASIHIGIINSLSGLVAHIKELKGFFEDPLRGIFVLSEYTTLGLNFQNHFIELNSLMEKNGISFSKNDPGYAIGLVANVSITQ